MDIEQKTRKIVERALQYGASDIHVVPDKLGGMLRFRVDGRLVDMEIMPEIFMKRMISHLKFVSGMDIGERRRPQNQGLELIVNNQKVFMRLSTFPSSAMESLVIRLFPLESEKEILQLSLFPTQTKELLELIKVKQGLIILCGPTGAGKTTTLYSLLTKRVKESHENIITLEDPVEQKQTNFLQMEINEKAGITYASGLKSLLRHDPDLIMLGEIRDPETAKMAIRASLSGHPVNVIGTYIPN
ncbi:ATPase, T2SS/T4P/T4SS family [Salipaludibacillus sp. CF4.18]|uniref:ATPase, T2SS/T4P/T4SS family n=1 Tax=Salipaludibacillus sp. CF4.18 TaxID=3373081 RepID=UPI003EE81097